MVPPYIIISVVIPTFRRWDRLQSTLAAMEAQTFAADRFEVIVSDDGSSDATLANLEAYGQRTAIQLRVVTGPNGGPAAARNRGIAQARGEWVAFTDDDCVPAVDWLEAFAAAIRDGKKFDGAGGFVERFQDTLLSRYIDWSCMMLPPTRADGTAAYLVTANAMFRRQLLVDLGGFDLAFKAPGGEDPDLSFRARDLGAVLVYLPTVKVRHMHRDTIKGIYRTWFQYGAGERVMDELRGRETDKRYMHMVRKEMGAVRKRLKTTVTAADRPVYLLCELVRRWAFSRGYMNASARSSSNS